MRVVKNTKSKNYGKFQHYAIYFYKMGIPCIPIKDGEPLFNNWKLLSSRIPPNTIINNCIDEHGEENIAIVLGKCSGLMAIKLSIINDQDLYENLNLMRSSIFFSNKDKKDVTDHYYFYRYNPCVIPKKFVTQFNIEVEILADNSFVELSDSMFSCGYKNPVLINPNSIAKLPILTLSKVRALCEEGIFEYLATGEHIDPKLKTDY